MRSTCCIARLTMLWWDDKLLEVLERMNVDLVAGARYMDDIGVWLRTIRLGWRVVDGILEYKEAWRKKSMRWGRLPCRRQRKL